ncbi:hypothetical protein [Streptomyces xantholiticus]|uniref:hypothetical protein n=1 Tax=Streptomyces xantholiticus TaxID=68285 RepID=UPI001677C8E8|nr:hypothetical protein [Streptomyces xantholiticus]GGW65100.1 hypothetical protein GCM10010381_57560 [Streptomyces xantholiticus]
MTGITDWTLVTDRLIMAITVVLLAYIALRDTSAQGRARVLTALSQVIHALAAVVRAFWGKQ